jgi:hypothetical protein
MLRLIPYKCTATSTKDDSFPQECLYGWSNSTDNEKCTKCGVSYKDAMTIWNKIQSGYWCVVPYEWRPKNIWYKFKCWGWKRYTTVKPRTLDHTWYDKSGLLPHVMFEILCRFVEEEMYPDGEEGIVDWSWTDDHQNAHDEMISLYKWWTEEYEEDYPFNIEPTPDNAFELEEQAQKTLRENCKRLIDVSPYMWT